ncbi:7-cyano-7-deazaguanine synthase QueC [Leptospira harrisiae]|uniref:7-cyano-7-deazaguanine synthase n=1 Tax=Leptospira harrisiae TaxID=2023189 RepID=A0A2N0AHG4_9LEPT|nr:7-cyano-7-deazaguanine synthase QueC [Leptospira harrisiae]PJZ83681.1 7-cyano-7-deazaguanine synthase QueC [Leptospira harrisiae]PKA06859.1 7-cyano-7-deazaguanine synthase QueC [Leptospira harrisiae]
MVSVKDSSPHSRSEKKGAVVLLSGGLDSTTCLYEAAREYGHPKNKKLPILALSFDYSQKHKIELVKSKKIAKLLGIKHVIQKLDPGFFLGSSLTEKNIKVRKNAKSLFSGVEKEIPNTYVPGRNILFLSFALSLAEGHGYDSIYIGVNALDYSGYPDCRPEFIESFQKMANLGTKKGVSGTGDSIQIKTPLLHLNKKEIIELGIEVDAPLHLTHSCYDPLRGKPCGKCDSCILRAKGFLEAGILDPALSIR